MEFDDLYQEIILDHYRSPRNKKPLPHIPEEQTHENPACGDSVKLDISIDNQDIITNISFDGSGCAINTASTSMMTELLIGKSRRDATAMIEQFLNILRGEQRADLLDSWGDLTSLKHVVSFPVRVKCATLAWNAVYHYLKK